MEFLKNHKIEVAYILGLAIVILLSKTVFASTDLEKEPVIVVEIEAEEISDDTSQTEAEEISDDTSQTQDVKLSENPLPSDNENEEIKIQNENVESETTGKTDNPNVSDMVVNSSEIINFLQTTNTCLIVLIFGIASVLGVLLSKCLFGWLM